MKIPADFRFTLVSCAGQFWERLFLGIDNGVINGVKSRDVKETNCPSVDRSHTRIGNLDTEPI